MAEEAAILGFLSSNECIEDTFPWSGEKKLDHKAVVGAVKSLSVDDYVSSSDLSFSYFTLSKEAETILENGSQEYLVFKAIVEKEGGMGMPDLQSAVGKNVAKIGMGNCMKAKWIKKDGANLVAVKTLDEVSDETQATLKSLKDADGSPDALDDKVSFDFIKSRITYS